MKIVSVDVGTRNASYCVLEMLPDKTIAIHAWRRMALFDETFVAPEDRFLCGETVQRKKRTELCGKRAYFYGTNSVGGAMEKHYCCRAHALAHPSKIVTAEKALARKTRLMKLGLPELRSLLHTLYSVPVSQDNLPTTKKAGVDAILFAQETSRLRSIPKHAKPKVNGNNVSAITLSETLTQVFDAEPALEGIERVYIEQQIRSKMILVQNLLMQYFMCRLKTSDRVHIIHAKYKLQGFIRPKHLLARYSAKQKGPSKINHLKNKQCGKLYCKEMLRKLVPRGHCDWIEFFDSFDEAKQDDLADAFLQGIWAGAFKL